MRAALVILAACGTAPDLAAPDAAPPVAPPDAPAAAPFVYPPGCYAPSAATDGPIPDAMFANPGLVGIAVTIEWRELETADNQFAWGPMDDRIAEATAHGEHVIIGITASAAKAPDWLVATQGVTSLQIADPNPNHGTGMITVVPFWDPTFRAQKLELIRAAGAHFASNPNVVGVMTAFANYFTNDWGIPIDMKTPDYSYDTMVAIGEEVLTTTAQAFPNQAIKLPIGQNDAALDPNVTTTHMADDILAFAQASAFAPRFFAQKNLINTNSPLATDPAIDNADPNSNDYLLRVLRDMSPHAGLQMVASATDGAGDGCRQNAHQTPCPPYDVLAKSIDISQSYAPTYLEFWTADAKNPDLYPLFESATQAMQAR